ncbi:MAG: ABC transporter ATP-binding protein [Anaerolineae bacterium]
MLEVKDLHTYYGHSHILQGISLTVEEGEVVCLLGRNGAGKTTTLRSIIGLTPPRSGRITFRGVEITGRPPFQICRLGVGYAPQDRRIFPDLTVDENLEVVKRKSAGNGWTHRSVYDLFPELSEIQNRPGRNLSGGERQMLTLARALMVNPQLLLLDEPSEGLAPLVVRRLEELVLEITRQGIALLLAEQNMRFTSKLAHRGYIIDKGRIRHQGVMEELQRDEEIIGKFLAV